MTETQPLTKACPKCRKAMHVTYHGNQYEVHEGTGHRSCPGGEPEHLFWLCECSYFCVTPPADAEPAE